MNLDSKTKGQLGMRGCQGMWDRLDRYNVKRRRRSTTPRRKSVATSKAVACEPAARTQWHAVCETATGRDRAFIAKAASKTEFDRMAAHHCDGKGWKFLWSKKAVLMGK